MRPQGRPVDSPAISGLVFVLKVEAAFVLGGIAFARLLGWL